jgi:SAM-dependent methyltransferase
MSKPEDVKTNEIAFFDHHYATASHNPTGWRLRMERELSSVLRATRGQALRSVLSIGCGDGAFERMLAPHAQKIIALDISPTAIEVARRNAAEAGRLNIEFRCQSAADLAGEERFDAIVCLAFLHHVPEPELPDFLRSCASHLVPGGLMYSQDPNRNAILRKIGRFVLGAKRYASYHSPDERELDSVEVRAMYKAAGFSHVDIGCIDFTLIPASYLLPRGPSFFLRAAAVIDKVLCATPFRSMASGFFASARR